jgi:hypothetical protein
VFRWDWLLFKNGNFPDAAALSPVALDLGKEAWGKKL